LYSFENFTRRLCILRCLEGLEGFFHTCFPFINSKFNDPCDAHDAYN